MGRIFSVSIALGLTGTIASTWMGRRSGIALPLVVALVVDGVSEVVGNREAAIDAAIGARAADATDVPVNLSGTPRELQQADPSQYSVLDGGGVHVAFSPSSQILLTSGDEALEAWEISSGLQLFDAFAAHGDLNPSATTLAAVAGGQLSLYPCSLCGGLPALLATAHREVTRGLTPQERLTYLGSS